jgi:soluble lytic murein transglycosylase-like protein
MSFDLKQLLSDPSFQYGMSLLGTARMPNSFEEAQRAYQASQKLQAEQALQQAQTSRLGQQTALEQQQMDIAKQQWQRQLKFYDQIGQSPLFNGQSAQIQDQSQQGQQNQEAGAQVPVLPTATSNTGQMPAQVQGEPSGVDKYGTPTKLLDNLMQTESSGNPLAVNKGSGAMGAFQFMPSTVAALKKQGITFNPFDANQSRDAASQYIQQLVKQNGGDYAKAMAAYGGFKTQSPDQYVGKVLAGVSPQPSISTVPVNGQIPQVAGGQNPGMEAMRVGALAGMAGIKGGEGMIELGKAMQPTNIPSGSYQRDANGRLTYVPDPMAQQKLEAEFGQSGVQPGLTKADLSKSVSSINEATNKQIFENYNTVKEIPNTLDALNNAKAALPKAIQFTGPLGERRLQAAKLINSTIGPIFGISVSPEATANADIFKSQVTQPLLASIATTGGRMSPQEMAKMSANFSNLDSDPNAIPKILDALTKRYSSQLAEHNNFVSQAKKNGVPMPIDYTIPTHTSDNISQTVNGKSYASAESTPIGGIYNGFVRVGQDYRSPKSWAKPPATAAGAPS